jgi:soluble lytic murein transglycosylase
MLRAFKSIASLAAIAAALSSSPAMAARDDDFLSAREAFRVGDARKLDMYAKRLQGYVLEPYVAYWQLRMRLEDASAAEIRRFIVTHADTPLASRLLADWLRQLGRMQQWELFDAEYPRYAGDDLDVICYGIQSKTRGESEQVQEARSLWFVPRELPDGRPPRSGRHLDADPQRSGGRPGR